MQFTIGIPFHNNESTLADAIRAVYAQSVQDWELLLVDDGSTDRSLEIARAVRDSRVTVLHDKEQRHLPHRLNQMIDRAQGEYFARMDSDDLMHPQRLERQLARLQEHPEIDLLGTGAYSIDLESNPLGVRGLSTHAMTSRFVLDHGPLIHATAVGPLRWFRANRYNPQFLRAEDRELFCRTHRRATFANLTEPLYLVREVGEVTLAKYVATCAMQRRLICLYGREMVGMAGALQLLLKTTLKELLYRLCFLTRTEFYLIRRRNQPLTTAQETQARAVVRQVLSTRVPGLD